MTRGFPEVPAVSDNETQSRGRLSFDAYNIES
jgi:hypothetical protein